MIVTVAGVGLLYAVLMMAIDDFAWRGGSEVILNYMLLGAAFAVGGAVLLVAVTMFTLPRRLKRLYDDLRVAGRETTYRFGAEGLHCSNRDGSSHYTWDRFKNWIENDQFMVFVLSRWAFVIVPKAQAPAAQIDALRSAAGAGGLSRA